MKKTTRTSPGSLLAAAGLGALAMYLLDPQQRRRRVALARDQMMRLARTSRQMAQVGLRDLSHRATGLVAEARGGFKRETPDDEVLVERVRSHVGRLVSHPHAIRVSASMGRVTLSGPILKSEEMQVLRGVQAVRGVQEVENLLEVHKTDDNVPALQGGKARPQPPQSEFMQRNWAPGPRLLALAAGGALAAYGLVRRGASGAALGVVGAGLAARAASNKGIGRLLGIPGRRAGADSETGIAPRNAVQVASVTPLRPGSAERQTDAAGRPSP